MQVHEGPVRPAPRAAAGACPGRRARRAGAWRRACPCCAHAGFTLSAGTDSAARRAGRDGRPARRAPADGAGPPRALTLTYGMTRFQYVRAKNLCSKCARYEPRERPGHQLHARPAAGVTGRGALTKEALSGISR